MDHCPQQDFACGADLVDLADGSWRAVARELTVRSHVRDNRRQGAEPGTTRTALPVVSVRATDETSGAACSTN